MAHALVAWAQRLSDLTPTEKFVFCAICDRVDPAQGGYFWVRLSDFVRDDLGGTISESTVRNHIAAIRRKGYIQTDHRGGGPKTRNTRLSRTHYRVLYPSHIAPETAEQFRLPLLTLIAQSDAMIRVKTRPHHGKSEPKLVRPQDESEPKLVRPQDESEPKLVRPQDESEPTSLYKNRRHVTEVATTEGAAAENLSASSFFEDVAKACAAIGVRGVRSSDFDKHRPQLSKFPRQLAFGDARWLADEFKLAVLSGRIDNPQGFLVHLVGDYLNSGGRRFYIEDAPDTWGTHDKPSTDVINF